MIKYHQWRTYSGCRHSPRACAAGGSIFLFAMPLINYVPLCHTRGCPHGCSLQYEGGWRTVVGIFSCSEERYLSVLIVTFLLTVVFDLTIAIEIGLLLAVVLFIAPCRQRNTEIKSILEKLDDVARRYRYRHARGSQRCQR